MANYSTSEFRSGLRIIIDGDPCIIVDNEFVKPGKGQAFNRVRIKNLKTGKTVDKTFKSGESVEAADVMDTNMQYLYSDGEFWHFMVQDTFEQYAADAKAVGDAKNWITDGDVCGITLWNNSPLIVSAPNFVELEIAETDPGVKGDTASGGVKPATLSTGAVVRVPCSLIRVRRSKSIPAHASTCHASNKILARFLKPTERRTQFLNTLLVGFAEAASNRAVDIQYADQLVMHDQWHDEFGT